MPALRHATHCAAAFFDGAVVDAHHGLVVQPQRFVRQCRAQRDLERMLVQPVLRQVGIQELKRVAAELLGTVHRDVCVLKQLFRIIRVVGIHRNAY